MVNFFRLVSPLKKYFECEYACVKSTFEQMPDLQDWKHRIKKLYYMVIIESFSHCQQIPLTLDNHKFWFSGICAKNFLEVCFIILKVFLVLPNHLLPSGPEQVLMQMMLNRIKCLRKRSWPTWFAWNKIMSENKLNAQKLKRDLSKKNFRKKIFFYSWKEVESFVLESPHNQGCAYEKEYAGEGRCFQDRVTALGCVSSPNSDLARLIMLKWVKHLKIHILLWF